MTIGLMVWRIEGDAELLEGHGADATIWRWCLLDDAGLRTEVDVKVSGSAMASALELLPEPVGNAVLSQGRTTVEELLTWWQPPRVVALHAGSENLGLALKAGGSQDEILDDDHPAATRRREIIEAWFAERAASLWYDRHGDVWSALILPDEARVGAARAGTGATKTAAAQDALKLYLGEHLFQNPC